MLAQIGSGFLRIPGESHVAIVATDGSARLTIMHTGQHMPVLKLPTNVVILFGFQGLVKVLGDTPWPTHNTHHSRGRGAKEPRRDTREPLTAIEGDGVLGGTGDPSLPNVHA